MPTKTWQEIGLPSHRYQPWFVAAAGSRLCKTKRAADYAALPKVVNGWEESPSEAKAWILVACCGTAEAMLFPDPWLPKPLAFPTLLKIVSLLAAGCGRGCFRYHAGNFHGFDAVQDRLQAGSGIGAAIHVGMTAAVGMHDEHAGLGTGLLHHVGQVMTVIAGQGCAQQHQVKRILVEGLGDGLASFGGLNNVPGLFHGRGLRCQNISIAFAIKNS